MSVTLLPPSNGLPPPVDVDDGVDSGRGEIWIGAGVAAAFFVLFLGWAAFARLDTAAYAQGQVTVAGNRQSVQSKDGGIVSALNVKEGQVVKQGDVLIELAGADVRAQESALAAQVYELQAEQARLRAEQFGRPAITWPPEFANLTGQDLVAARNAMRVQQSQFDSRAAFLASQKNVLRQKSAELAQQIEGLNRQIASADEQTRLVGEELSGMKSLAAEGFAPQTRVRSLERDQAQLGGQRGQYGAEVAQTREQVGETQLQALQLDRQHADDVATQLHDVETQLDEAIPKLSAAKDALARIEVRAPASGAVVGLSVFTVGGVVAPGQKLMDIVPDKAALVIQARLAPADVDDLRVGRALEVRFPSLHDRTLPVLKGTLTKVSADSFVDEHTGASYFQIEGSVPADTVDRLKLAEDGQFQLKPGMPAQLLIPLRKRTALEYLTQPMTDAVWRSFHEK
ncbi:MAG TPA: HlyD family type I secretion periplasmic adaptor subunit [Caulobacteraceae bacterium]|nr:HlyD family type I secretion periplasmic adaptor subunit [Caulobacteraceae bacterium]